MRQLTSEEAAAGYPVHLKGVVLYYDQTNFRDLVIQDPTASIYLAGTEAEAYQLNPGDVVEIEGRTSAGGYSPMVVVSNLTITGRSPLPDAPLVSYETMMTGGNDGQWVKVVGIVREAMLRGNTNTGAFFMDLVLAGGGRVGARVARSDYSRVSRLVDAEVTVSGVCSPLYNQRRQLLGVRLSVPHLDQIQIDKPAPEEPFAEPALAINSLLQYRPQARANHRVKVRGTVLLQDLGQTLFIQDATQGLRVKTRQTTRVQIGDQVEVIGFPSSVDYSLVMEDATFRRTASGSQPKPAQLGARELLRGVYDSEFVQLQGELLDWLESENQHVLLLQEGGILFRAYLPRPERTQDIKMPLRSRVQLTGICLVQFEPGRVPHSFRLLLRSPADLRIVQQPPWWTLPRLLAVLGATSALAVAALGWVATLKIQVRRQTRVIQQSVERQAVLEERTRIARDFHDTIEQQLAAVALQLQAARLKIEQSPEFVKNVLRLAESMLRHAQTEARRSVWELRAAALETGTLNSALAAVANYAGNGSPLEVSVKMTGQERPLPAAVENHLLRIGQEAAANAVKHGAATKLVIELHYNPDSMQMRIKDNGKGFDVRSAASGQAGHFGLLGMRERAEKLGGELAVNSASGFGTEVVVTLPTPLPAEASNASATS